MNRATALESDDLYARLGVDAGATTDDIKRAYRALLREYPPERAPEQFKRIREAYETLGNPVSREEYDQRPEPVVAQWLHIAHQALNDNEYSLAERYFKQVLLQQPDLLFVRNFLGLCFLYQGQAEKAITQFERLLREPSASAAWFANAGHAYGKVKRYLDAEHAFEEALRRNPDGRVDYVIGLVDIYLAQQKFGRAVKLLEDAIKADGVVDFQDLRFFTKLVEVAIRERNGQRLADVIQRVQRIAEDDEQRQYLAWKLGTLGQQLIAAGGFVYGIQLADAARRLQPGDPDYTALHEIGRLLDRRDFAAAERLLAEHGSFHSLGWLEELGTAVRAYMAENRALAELQPISAAPPLGTLNGVGTTLYGERDHDARTGSYVTTLYFVILFIPLFPITCYRVIRDGTGWRFLGRVPYSARETRHWIGVAVALLLIFLWNGAGDEYAQARASASTGVPAPTARPQGGPGIDDAPTPGSPVDRFGGAVIYAGRVVNDGWPDSPASLRLAFDPANVWTGGSLDIGSPLGGSGPFRMQLASDTVTVVSYSPSGDTIVWAGLRSSGSADSIVGRYAIISGPSAGQGGGWHVVQQSSNGIPRSVSCVPSFDWFGDYGPRSGTERSRPRRRGYGSLKVSNGTRRDAVIVLRPVSGGGEARAMFVRQSESSSFTRVAPGSYRVQYAMGSVLDERTWRFCGGASYSQFDDIVYLQEIRDAEGVRYSTFELTLHAVSGGTATQTDILPSTFEVPAP